MMIQAWNIRSGDMIEIRGRVFEVVETEKYTVPNSFRQVRLMKPGSRPRKWMNLICSDTTSGERITIAIPGDTLVTFLPEGLW